MKNVVIVGVALALSVSNAVAQSGSSASPSDVAREFFAAERDGRWLDAARLLDLKSFEPQRARSVSNARHAPPPFHLTVERLLRDDPSMPRAVAEYQVKQSESVFRDFNPLSYEYADVPTADSLAALPVDVAGARWLEARDPRWQMKRQPRSFSASCSELSDSEQKTIKVLDGAAASMLTPPPREVVAVALAGLAAPGSTDSLSYVLYRDRYENRWDSTARKRMARPEMQMTPRVLTMIRTPVGWRVLPVSDFGFGNGMSIVSFDCAADSVKPRAKKK